jgi:aspartate kinase
MALIVQKFGGTSMGSIERIQHVADIVLAKQKGHDVVVVVSAMHGETDRLIQLANAITPDANKREYDVLVSSGEQVSMALLAIALTEKGCPARSYTGSQAGIYTDAIHAKARINAVKANKILADLAQQFVVIVAGFQGMNEKGDITTLGRGGSDVSAVALAAALKADECQIYTDVDGVFTTDPRMLPEATLLSHISFEEMLEMASLGAKVLQMRSVELACKQNVSLRVLSSFNNGPGTLVTFEEKLIHKRLVSGIAFTQNEAIISLSGVPNNAGVEGYILGEISKQHIEIDMIAQNASDTHGTDFTFSLERQDYSKALTLIKQLSHELGADSVRCNPKVAKLSLVGIGMRSHSGVASTMFKALGDADIKIQMITTSEIKISVIIDECHLEQGVRAVHTAFELHTLNSPAHTSPLES